MQIAIKPSYTYEEAITTQILDEAGDLLECDHAGAEEEDMEFEAMSWWADAHMYVPDDSTTETVLVCDKENCKAWLDHDGIWRND